MLFRKKKPQKTNDCKVQFKRKFPSRPNTRRKVRSNCPPIKAKSLKPSRGSCNLRAEKVKKMRRRNSILGIFLLFFIIFVGIFSAYTIINFITGIRGGTSIDDLLYDQKYVEGIEKVPIYPKSEFVYNSLIDDEIVLRMLNQGLSVYKLPRNTKSSNVYEFYEENLPQNDWEYLSITPISTEDKLLGQYWFKGAKGLRIYVENSDVWYELLTKNEAENSLSERRKAEIQRKRILETSTEQSLLPDYPWILSIPREYLTRYSSTDMGELQSVEIFEIAGEANFIIYPIGKINSGSYDQMLHDFFEKQSEELDENWSIVNTKKDYRKDREVLTAKLIVGGKDGEGIVLMNQRNFIVYAIIANQEDHPFFEEIIKEITEP